MFKKIMYSLGALAVLAMAVGAGFKPNSAHKRSDEALALVGS